MAETTEPKKTYLLPEDLRNDLLTFLMQQPYLHVAKGIQRLEALAEVQFPTAGTETFGTGVCGIGTPVVVPPTQEGH